MDRSYTIFIPTTIFNQIAPTAVVDALRTEVKLALAAEFGGYTETTRTGGFVSQTGELIEERVYTIEACFEVENDELIYRLANKIKADLSQESVMIRKDTAVSFV